MIETIGIVGFVIGIGAVIGYIKFYQPMRDYLIEIKRYEQFKEWELRREKKRAKDKKYK